MVFAIVAALALSARPGHAQSVAAPFAAMESYLAAAAVVILLALLYLVHGLLHLCGHDDHAPRDRKRMRAQERHYLEAMGVKLKGGADW